jgi:hypothetical protein
LEVRLKKPTLVLQMWLKQVLQQEQLTDIERFRTHMQQGSIERFLVPRRIKCGQQHSNVCPVDAASTIVRWLTGFLRARSKSELPRMGIGDPG